jgi:hypothetical protein
MPESSGAQKPSSQKSDRRIYRGRIEPSGQEVTTEGPADFWEPHADFPHDYTMKAWQCTDDDHPPGGGVPGYRIAYKTIKLFSYPNTVCMFRNARLVIGHGSLNRGGVHLPDAVPGRHWNHYLIPEYGRLVRERRGIRYAGSPNLTFDFQAYEEEVPDVSYVEIIVRLDGLKLDEPETLFGEGRMKVSPMRLLLDAIFGPRLIGSCLFEEVGCVFDDWHWNRWIGSARLAAESQVPPQIMTSTSIKSRLSIALDRYDTIDDVRKRKIRFASRWLWLAEEEPDRVNRFIQYWLVIESLEMKTSHPGPAKKRLAKITGTPADISNNFIGRLLRLRGDLVHGDAMKVTETDLEGVSLAAKLFLSWHLMKAVPWEARRRLIAIMEN